MTNKPMLSIERELLDRLAKIENIGSYVESGPSSDLCPACLNEGKWNWAMGMVVSVNPIAHDDDCPLNELRALLDKEIDGDSHAPKHQGEPVAEVEREFDNSPAHVHLYQDFPDGTKLYAEQPAPVADHPQCEECKGWGYHENHYEGGGTECGECGGSGNATVAVAVVMPDVDELAQIIRKVDGSHTLGAGSLAEAILEEVARLNGVKP